MEISDTTVLEIWNVFCDYLPPAKRADLAVKFVKTLMDEDIELGDLDDIRGEDEHLDHAIDELGEDDNIDEEEYDE